MKLDQLQEYFREEEALFRNYSPDNTRTNKKIKPVAVDNLKDRHNGDEG